MSSYNVQESFDQTQSRNIAPPLDALDLARASLVPLPILFEKVESVIKD
jgi:hypothetical protein